VPVNRDRLVAVAADPAGRAAAARDIAVAGTRVAIEPAAGEVVTAAGERLDDLLVVAPHRGAVLGGRPPAPGPLRGPRGPGRFQRRRPVGSDLSSVDPRTVDLAGAQVDVTQAVVLVTALGLSVRPDAPE
jgi:hypothetical protein